MDRKYIIISSVRNEEKYFEKTIQSVISQTIRPVKWVVVNDGSTDDTVKIIRKYLPRYNWIRLINRKNRGYYLLGVGPCEAFYCGFNTVKDENWDYLVKMDADLSFQTDYFESLFKKFEENPKLGMASGKTFIRTGNRMICEFCPNNHVRGPIKMYRKACWEGIGGIEKRRLWDTIDEMKAQKLGWETRSFYSLKVLHQRPIDARQKNPLKSKYVLGQNFYNIGYHPLFMCVKTIKIMILEKPRILGGAALFLGYMISLIKREKIYDYDLARFIRCQQMKRFNIRHLLTYFTIDERRMV